MPPGEHHQNKLVKDVFIGDVEVMLEGGEVDPPICLRGVVSSTTSEPLTLGIISQRPVPRKYVPEKGVYAHCVQNIPDRP